MTEVGDDDVGAMLVEEERCGSADAPRRSGYEDGFALDALEQGGRWCQLVMHFDLRFLFICLDEEKRRTIRWYHCIFIFVGRNGHGSF